MHKKTHNLYCNKDCNKKMCNPVVKIRLNL